MRVNRGATSPRDFSARHSARLRTSRPISVVKNDVTRRGRDMQLDERFSLGENHIKPNLLGSEVRSPLR
jgi:hypothetical protein